MKVEMSSECTKVKATWQGHKSHLWCKWFLCIFSFSISSYDHTLLASRHIDERPFSPLFRKLPNIQTFRLHWFVLYRFRSKFCSVFAQFLRRRVNQHPLWIKSNSFVFVHFWPIVVQYRMNFSNVWLFSYARQETPALNQTKLFILSFFVNFIGSFL